MLDIERVVPLRDFRLRLTLSNGQVVKRSVGGLLHVAELKPVRKIFETAKLKEGSVVWGNGASIPASFLLWGGPAEQGKPAQFLELRLPGPAIE